MAVRKFWFINGLGNKFNLTIKEEKHFLSDPTGLGFNKSIATISIGDSEIKTDEAIDMPSVSGNVLFYDKIVEAYQQYFEFIDFLKYEPLKLFYNPPNTVNPYYIDCDVVTLDKSEFTQEGYLSCPITIYGKSLWLDSKETILTAYNELGGEGKYYELERDYSYEGNALQGMILNVNGHLPVGFKYEIYGNVTNPILTAYQNDVKYGICKLDGSFDYVCIDSDDTTESIALKKDDALLANPYSYQDLSIADGVVDVTFFKLKVGESMLSFSSDDGEAFNGYIKLTWKDKRISV